MVDEARRMAESLGSLNNSITNGEGNFAGFLGELAIAFKYKGERMDKKDTDDLYNHDLLIKGKMVEVKTKRRGVKPKGKHTVTVAQTSRHQQPDWYAFVSVQYDRTKAKGYGDVVAVWLCGWYRAEDFFDDATFYKKGEAEGDNGFTAPADCYILPISQLIKY